MNVRVVTVIARAMTVALALALVLNAGTARAVDDNDESLTVQACEVPHDVVGGYQRFVDMFMVVSVGLSSLVVVLRIVFRSHGKASQPTPTRPPSRSPTHANAHNSNTNNANNTNTNSPNSVASSTATATTPSASTSAITSTSSGVGGVKERLESELRALLPRRSPYYARPFFADAVASKSEFVGGLLELGDDALDGWLLVKKGLRRGRHWKKRYVVLDANGRLTYYPHADAARKRGNLKGALTVHAVRPADPSAFGSHTLEVRGVLGDIYLFRTEDEMAARKWLAVLTQRAIQRCVRGRRDSTLTFAGNGEDATETSVGPTTATTTSSTTESTESATPTPGVVLRTHRLEATVAQMTYGKEATLRQFYVVAQFKSGVHDHGSDVPVGQTVPTPCAQGVVSWHETLAWRFQDHECRDCAECAAAGATAGGVFTGLPDMLVFHVYEIHLRYLTTKVGRVAISLQDAFGAHGMRSATVDCDWPVLASANDLAELGQLSVSLSYRVGDGDEEGKPLQPFLVSTEAERELVGEYDIHGSLTDCAAFFALFYADNTATRWQNYYKARGDTEVDVGDWAVSSEHGGQVRVITFRSLTNASIGPSTTMTTNTQHIHFAPPTGAAEGETGADSDRFILESKVFLHDIPYGDCFSVEQVTIVERRAATNTLVAKSYLGIPFSKGCMFKSKIISATRDGVTQSTRLLFEELNKVIAEEEGGTGGGAETVQPFLVTSGEERQLLGEYDLHASLTSPRQFFELFYANDTSARWQACYQETGDTDHVCSAWQPSTEYGGMVRVIKYRAQNNGALGPPSSAATMDQHVILPKEAGEGESDVAGGGGDGSASKEEGGNSSSNDSGGSLVIESKLELFDIPFGDCFTVEVVYVVERASALPVGGGSASNLVARVYIGVPFSKSTMFKGKIVSATKDGFVKTTKTVFEHINRVAEAELATDSTGARLSTVSSSSRGVNDAEMEPRRSSGVELTGPDGSTPPRRVMLARLNSTLDGSVALEEIFENQRVSIFGKWGPNHLLPTDRSRFTNRNGDVALSFEQISLPPDWVWTSPWKIDTSYTECDEDGWSYATDFPRFKAHLARGKSSSKRLGASVRRRRWIRMMAFAPAMEEGGDAGDDTTEQVAKS